MSKLQEKELGTENDVKGIRVIKMSKVLLVIDMQEVTVGEYHADFFYYNADLTEKVNNVISTYDEKHIIYIRNVMKNNLINKLAPFKAYEGSKEAELSKGLKKVNGNIIDKFKGDAFSNPALQKMLQSLDADEIELVGVDGGGCVALTAIGALKNGYKVSLLTNAIGTQFEKQATRYSKKLEGMGARFME